MTAVRGISADLHDAAAAVVIDGVVEAAAAEERFTRVKHDPRLPRHAVAWALEATGVGPGELECVAFHDKPFTTYERILVTHGRVGPVGVRSLTRAVAAWSRRKLWVEARIRSLLRSLGHQAPRVVFAEHHVSHAAAAFLPSPFPDATILCLDGVGEWATSSVGVGSGNGVELLEELRFPDSVGLLYSTLTAHCGFAVNDGEYKLMGLAPYGTPRFADRLRDEVVDIRPDGSVRLDQRWFAYQAGDRMGARSLDRLLDGPPRRPGAPLGDREADLAASMQVVLEEIVLGMARHAFDRTGVPRLCMAGGVALNCVANARIAAEGPFDEVWVQPASGDDGSAIGAALWAHHQVLGHERVPVATDGMSGALLGPAYADGEVHEWLDRLGIEHRHCADLDELCTEVAGQLATGRLVGWFQGRMEFGPRALGARSILADPRDPEVVRRLNAAVKRREGFRPFAPAVLEERAAEWFEIDGPLPYMLRTALVHPARRRTNNQELPADASMADRLAVTRSEIPACTHVDHSARVQTVGADRHPTFHRLLRAVEAATGCPVLLNTSFNGREEPIVRTPADALRCFVGTDLDVLVIERCVVSAEAARRAPGVATERLEVAS